MVREATATVRPVSSQGAMTEASKPLRLSTVSSTSAWDASCQACSSWGSWLSVKARSSITGVGRLAEWVTSTRMRPVTARGLTSTHSGAGFSHTVRVSHFLLAFRYWNSTLSGTVFMRMYTAWTLTPLARSAMSSAVLAEENFWAVSSLPSVRTPALILTLPAFQSG